MILTPHIFLTLIGTLSGALLLIGPAFAQWEYDARLVPILPPYCMHTQLYRNRVDGGTDESATRYWKAVMGERNFLHMHHYCWGLENVHRSTFKSRTKREREFELERSIAQFDYVLQRVSPDFPLLPEILTKKAQSLIRLKRGPEAVIHLHRAIEMKPEYWPPYLALSDMFQANEDHDQARLWLERAAAIAPENKMLARRLAEAIRAGR